MLIPGTRVDHNAMRMTQAYNCLLIFGGTWYQSFNIRFLSNSHVLLLLLLSAIYICGQKYKLLFLCLGILICDEIP